MQLSNCLKIEEVISKWSVPFCIHSFLEYLHTENPMQRLNIMIADDHQLFREGMESLLRKLPDTLDVYHAGNGIEAMDVLERNAVDLIFMDIRMPHRSGVETTKMIRDNGNRVNIIAITMLEDTNSVVSMFRAGVNGYLLKNTSFTELQEAIKAVMSGERYYAKNISNQLLDAMLVTNSSLPPRKFENILLTLREKEIVGLISRGFANKEIAEILSITPKTVENHRGNVYTKLKIKNTLELVQFAIQEGIVTGGK